MFVLLANKELYYGAQNVAIGVNCVTLSSLRECVYAIGHSMFTLLAPNDKELYCGAIESFDEPIEKIVFTGTFYIACLTSGRIEFWSRTPSDAPKLKSIIGPIQTIRQFGDRIIINEELILWFDMDTEQYKFTKHKVTDFTYLYSSRIYDIQLCENSLKQNDIKISLFKGPTKKPYDPSKVIPMIGGKYLYYENNLYAQTRDGVYDFVTTLVPTILKTTKCGRKIFKDCAGKYVILHEFSITTDEVKPHLERLFEQFDTPTPHTVTAQGAVSP